MKEILATAVGCFLMITTAAGQQAADSLLPEAIITAYGQQQSAGAVPAAVSTLSARDFQQSGEATPVLAFQKLPGVRLEERSPGSYRISIRGSSLRSPFGVRNVKVYWDNLPVTEANGNTSLNLLDVSLYQQVEVIRGPAASYYGAGTGGVINIGSLPRSATTGLRPEAELATGSFSYMRGRAGFQQADSLKKQRFGITYHSTKGYREHSSLERQNVFWSSSFKVSAKRELQASILLARIDYDIPGGLSEEQFRENPRQARPGNAFVSGNAEQNSSINQKYALVGIGQHYHFTESLENRTWFFG
ncbi:MAG: TonB-dependent receptor plug domain-containing protein, partial [Bacteroidetes bacterium]|nr:TonB-dependent receptor plug domain-containing protein [Bacteroidota bacterium]